jgi:predicted MFS family arabinose efflux permease
MVGAAPAANTKDGARFAVAVLTAMNLLNYMDRYVPSSVKDLVKADLKLTDTETSLPLTAFVLVYMCASPIFGSLADRVSRRVLLASGVALWSIATGAAAFATGFGTFLLARALVGVGEAAYATIGPALLADFFAPGKRNRVLTVFYVAIPVGTAVGFSAGGYIGPRYGWRTAFLVCALPGLAAAALALKIRDPGRGASDEGEAAAPSVPWGKALAALAKNREYVTVVAGYAAVTFAGGAMADWFPTFLQRHRGFALEDADHLIGLAVVIGGLGGTAFGGWLADRLKTRNPYFALSGVTMLLAGAASLVALIAHDRTVIVVAAFASQFLMWCYNGPVNAVIANCVPSALRTRAFALSIFAIHVLGDAISPAIVGRASDKSANLPVVMHLVPATMLLGAIVWLVGWRALAERTPRTA